MAIGSVIVEGHAIVSEDGMIADAQGVMPAGLRNEADWRLFQEALDRAELVVVGRLGHQRHPNSGRRRLVLTRQIADLAPDPGDPNATLWNPAGVPIGAVLQRLNVTNGALAITGGSFDLFLPCYDRFALAEVPGFTIPSGTPCFRAGLPEPVLTAAGMKSGAPRVIDEAAGVTLTMWTRQQG
ncbi:MAG TPA: hypothetical protein VFV70_08130 [Hyphomonadaceae bacterium]|nr:hypothetical protein [Hyphomonadaceae bacterium]